jgi:hypothetical protein
MAAMILLGLWALGGPAYATVDSDLDGLCDEDELLLGTDPTDADTDDDGLSDGEELGGDGVLDLGVDTDPLDRDTDEDGLEDGAELDAVPASDPLLYDTDADSISDGVEAGVTEPVLPGVSAGGVAYAGSDLDAFVPDADPTSTTDPTFGDTDRDGLNDGVEDVDWNGAVDAGETDPSVADTDGDGLDDGSEVELHDTDPLEADSDGDGLTDGEEVDRYGTNPNDTDSDEGGVDDAAEIAAGSDPFDPLDDFGGPPPGTYRGGWSLRCDAAGSPGFAGLFVGACVLLGRFRRRT